MKLTVSPLHRPLTLKYFSHNGKNIFYLSIRLLRRGCIFFLRKIKYITLGACVVILQRLYSFDLKSINYIEFQGYISARFYPSSGITYRILYNNTYTSEHIMIQYLDCVFTKDTNANTSFVELNK